MLRSQAVYAREKPRCWRNDGIEIGRALFPCLPEDRFDVGPVVGGGGRWILVADVRLDARHDLCETLGLSENAYSRLSDADVVMCAVERWGEDAIPRLIGDFALILWDLVNQRLVLARDFIGQRPLHYHQGSGFVAVASMPKGLHALASVPRAPDPDGVAAFLALMPDGNSQSYFRDVHRVLPGEIAVFRSKNLDRRRYWNFRPTELSVSHDEYPELVKETFDRAVAARLRGAGQNVGAQLSGGLDSGAVAATAARIFAPNGEVVAFTSAPQEYYSGVAAPGRFSDESEHAAAVAAQYSNMRHVVIRASSGSPLAALDRNFFLFDRPVLNICNSVWVQAILDDAKDRSLNVLLVGDRGNITISYDGFDGLGDLVATRQWLRAAREIVLLRLNGVRLRRSGAKAFGPLLSPRLWKALNRWVRRPVELSDFTGLSKARIHSFQELALQQGVDLSFQPGQDSFGARSAGMQYIDTGNYQKGYLGGWGIDVRDPTADRRVAELCLSIPAKHYLHDGQTRSIARRAFSDRLPALVLNETRNGYQAADWHEGFRADWNNAKQELAAIARFPIAADMIDIDRMGRLLEDPALIKWGSAEVETSHRLALLRGLSAGHFLRRASGAN